MRKRKWKVRQEEFPTSFGILEAEYDPRNEILVVVVWNHGNPEVLGYTEVPPEAFDGLVKADSKGGYFNKHIRNIYPYMGKTS